MTETEQRAMAVAEARKWNGTPYHHRAKKIGHGCDCLYLLSETFIGCGLIRSDFDPGVYSKQWFLHRDEEKYLDGLMEFAHPIEDEGTPIFRREVKPTFLPADILVFQHGRTFSHGVIVTEWPYVIHASAPARCVLEETIEGNSLSLKKFRAFSYWGSR